MLHCAAKEPLILNLSGLGIGFTDKYQQCLWHQYWWKHFFCWLFFDKFVIQLDPDILSLP
jgi:hypothetical protein